MRAGRPWPWVARTMYRCANSTAMERPLRRRKMTRYEIVGAKRYVCLDSSTYLSYLQLDVACTSTDP